MIFCTPSASSGCSGSRFVELSNFIFKCWARCQEICQGKNESAIIRYPEGEGCGVRDKAFSLEAWLSVEATLAVCLFLVPQTWCKISMSSQAFRVFVKEHRQLLLQMLCPALLGSSESLLQFVRQNGRADGVYCMLFGELGHSNLLQMLEERDPTNGFTPLMNATYYGAEAATVALLLGSRANPNTQSYHGGTALSSASYVVASAKGLRHIEILLDYRADPLIYDRGGDNALHCAAYGGSQEAVNMILCAGVSINVQNSGGWTALRYAYQEGHTDLVHYLKSRGAAE